MKFQSSDPRGIIALNCTVSVTGLIGGEFSGVTG
jgi:hypothetical protein